MPKSKRVSYRTRVVHRTRRVGGRIKRHVKAAKPSLAIIAGLATPAVLVLGGASQAYGVKGLSTNPTELRNRFVITYLGGDPVKVSGIVQSTAVKAAALGFIAHGLANWTGVNRAMARMKWPVRI